MPSQDEKSTFSSNEGGEGQSMLARSSGVANGAIVDQIVEKTIELVMPKKNTEEG